MSFSSPLWLFALLLLPLLLVAYVLRERMRRRGAVVWSAPALLPNLVDEEPGARRHLPLAILLVGLATMIVGVARPHANVTVRREEATVLLTIDVSRSMEATDVPPTRLRAAKTAALHFIDQVPKKFRIGVVSFATRAQIAVAPTDNRELVRSAVESLRTGEGTAIGDAVVLAASLGTRQRIDGVVPPTSVLLISDGARDGGTRTPQFAARRASALHVRVYTILLGTARGIVRHTLPNGYTETLRVPPSAQTLQLLARATGGEFFTASNDRRLAEVYDQLRSRLGHKQHSREITDLFAAGSALLLLSGGGLSAFWFRRVP